MGETLSNAEYKARMRNHLMKLGIAGPREIWETDTETDGPDFSRLDAVQGGDEARTELHKEVLLGSTAVDDAVMRQESAGLPATPVSRADGEGVGA